MNWPFTGLERGKYTVIYADPPWRYRTFSDKGLGRSAESHYQTMTLEEICALPVKDLAAREGCHLFLWTTGPCLPQAFQVMERWGFRYSSTAFVWVKLRRREQELFFDKNSFFVGMGHTTRKNCEYCLLGRRGKPRRLSKAVRELVVAPVQEHSRKPEEVRERIERYAAGPYAEMFARRRTAGWEAWGNQVDLFPPALGVGAAS
ncbi:MAG: DNA methyltransferase [Rhodospirillales bacterium]|nr:DNA methyltransferase [Rhodospirillales bacterium]